eukprot:COSAG01_NODE_1336_length_10676_cov_7.741420_5_plen_1470_part_00
MLWSSANKFGCRRTLAHHAACHGHAAVLRVLHDLDVSLVDRGPASPSKLSKFAVDFASAYTCSTAFRPMAAGRSPADLAARNGHAECLRVLIELGAEASFAQGSAFDHLRKDHNERGRLPNHCHWMLPAHFACQRGHVCCLEVLCEWEHSRMNGGWMTAASNSLAAPDRNGRTPASWAAAGGHEDCLNLLGDRSIGWRENWVIPGLSVADYSGATPAHWAAVKGHVKCLHALHKLGATASLWSGDCAELNMPRPIDGCNYNRLVTDPNRERHIKPMEYRRKGGSTPVHYACSSGNVECLQALADIRKAEMSDRCQNLKLSELRRQAKEHGAATGAIDIALDTDNPQLAFTELLQKISAVATVSMLNSQHRTPAHCACAGGHLAALQLLHTLGATASLAAMDEDGNTPAHLAALHGHNACLQTLHEFPVVDLAACNHEGWTIAHSAASGGSSECFRTLANLGLTHTFDTVTNRKQGPLKVGDAVRHTLQAAFHKQTPEYAGLKVLQEIFDRPKLQGYYPDGVEFRIAEIDDDDYWKYKLAPSPAVTRGDIDLENTQWHWFAEHHVAGKVDGLTPALLSMTRGHVKCVQVLHELQPSCMSDLQQQLNACRLAIQSRSAQTLRALFDMFPSIQPDLTMVLDAIFVDCEECVHMLMVQNPDLRKASEQSVAVGPSTSHKWCPAILAAMYGREGCLRALAKASTQSPTPGSACPKLLDVVDHNGEGPAHHAARHGHCHILLALHQLGADLSKECHKKRTVVHAAAECGGVPILRLLLELGTIANAGGKDISGTTAVHVSCERTEWNCSMWSEFFLELLKFPNVTPSIFTALDDQEFSPAFRAAACGGNSFEDFVSALQGISKARADCKDIVSTCLSQTASATSCATILAVNMCPEGLRVLQKQGLAHTFMEENVTLSPIVALITQCQSKIRAHCGPEEVKDSADRIYQCLKVLHEGLREIIDPTIQELQATIVQWEGRIGTSQLAALRSETEKTKARLIGYRNLDTNINVAFRMTHIANFPQLSDMEIQACSKIFCYLKEIGGLKSAVESAVQKLNQLPGVSDVATSVFLTTNWQLTYGVLLVHPSLLDLRPKQLWLHARLREIVEGADAQTLSLVATRSNILDGLCSALGVDENQGQIVEGTTAGPVDVRFRNEPGGGDGVRRDWLTHTVKELLDPGRGLFTSKDGFRTLQPNPHSKLTSGDDHLSYFALLGRITGLALAHKEPLDACFTPGFFKAVFGLPIVATDLGTVDPELFDKKVTYMRKCSAEELSALDVRFVDEDNTDEYTGTCEGPMAVCESAALTPLKEGGADIVVDANNLEEYLQVFAEYRLVGSIKQQIESFQRGLTVIVKDDVLKTLSRCCTVPELQVLICGIKTIDMEDWKRCAHSCPFLSVGLLLTHYYHRHTEYKSGFSESDPTVVFFWTIVEAMSDEDRSKLLAFVTGSPRVPALGFSSLQGYGGRQQRFTVQRYERI